MLFHDTPNENFITRLSPLVKILLLVSTAVFAFTVSDILLLGVCLGVILVTILVFDIRFGQAAIVIKVFVLGLPVLIGVFVLSYLWSVPGWREGLNKGLVEGSLYALRFLNLILVNFMVAACTDPREFICALRALRLPETLCQIIAHVINLLPRLARELRDILEAQTLRGMRWHSLWRPASWVPLAIPLILAAMRYSEQSAISLELRHGIGNPVYRLRKPALSDLCVAVLCAGIITYSIMQYSFPAGI
ncbi:MAG: energy-coupling factor transporter transmembrane component T [Gemmatimonadota bacterium]|nr:energy-coupling factor transporter transmembrane component T [Gemmatimonadota bacterium]